MHTLQIESLEEERLDLKRKIRQMAQERGKRIAASGILSHSVLVKVLGGEDSLDPGFQDAAVDFALLCSVVCNLVQVIEKMVSRKSDS